METTRIVLTPPSKKYTRAMWRVITKSQPELSTFLPWVTESLTLQALESNVQIAIDNYLQFTGEFWFNIVEKKTQSFIGVVGFTIRDPAVPYFELGYWLDSDKTGQGFASEAVALVERYAFEERNAQRLEIKMAGTNQQSRAVAERCGFCLEATLEHARRLPSGIIDSTWVYAKFI
ncbi:GNAT family N-acetyltransferase [Vibrio coralliilyticus]|uniref:GNAT family N-acetyltransferase n=1 Tax=Vibrio coralliilyticus TaxID=190893 RepID=A0AAP6ZU04_9VIBR|nr:GNAT family N-acetyltransferase [Vibrio coralliilyticus]NOJ24179.1 GNAT family N-acetyltransferase [Vibrio coralliilyticus]